MKIFIATDAGINVFKFPDDTSFVLDNPHGFMRVFPSTDPDKPAINRYFNMQYVVAIAADGDEVAE